MYPPSILQLSLYTTAYLTNSADLLTWSGSLLFKVREVRFFGVGRSTGLLLVLFRYCLLRFRLRLISHDDFW